MSPVRLEIAVAAIAAFLLGGCTGEAQEVTLEVIDLDPAQVVVPSNGYFEQVRSRADQLEDWPETVSLSTCRGYASIALPFGSAWVLAEPSEEGSCQVWLGGETEDPTYNGRPTQFCHFGGNEPPVPIVIGEGGPAHVDHPNCRDLF